MLDKLKELLLLIGDFLSYILTVLKTDREKRRNVIRIGVAVILVVVLAWFFSTWTPPSKRELDPESMQVIRLTISPSPTPTPVPVQEQNAATSSSGGITMINEYLLRKNAGGVQQTDAATADGGDVQEGEEAGQSSDEGIQE